MLILKLAVKDLLFDRLMTLCVTAAVAAVIAPLLLLFSLRYGILTTLETTLTENPATLEIRMLQGYRLDEAFFRQLRENPRVGFVVPMTRALSVSADVRAGGKVKTAVETIPSAAGDPLAARSGVTPPGDSQALITESLAADLGPLAVPGSRIKVAISRRVQGVTQYAAREFEISGIISRSCNSRAGVYLSLPAITAMEDWRDGYEPELFGDGSRPNAARSVYAKARIYARAMDDVIPLAAQLREKYEIADHTRDIENVKAIARVLDFVFYTIAATSLAGGAFALGGLIFSSIDRKEGQFALLQLTGLPPGGVTALVAVEGMLMAAAAYAVAFGFFLIGQAVFTARFGSLMSERGVISLLAPGHVLAGALCALLLALVIAVVCARWRLLRLTIAASLRMVR